jgi:hypothetical protein
MDALDRLVEPAGALLRQVETTLATAGAPEDDPLWPLLRRMRVLPADAVAGVAGWRAEPLEGMLPGLRSLRERYEQAADAAPAWPVWEGAGAETYAARWAALRAHLADPGPSGAPGPTGARGLSGAPGPAAAGGTAEAGSVAGRMSATIRFTEELADWVTASRRSMATALAEVLGCAEAVAVTAGGAGAGPAAARIATHLLGVAAGLVDEGQRLYETWRARLVELPYVASAVDGSAGTPRTLRITG